MKSPSSLLRLLAFLPGAVLFALTTGASEPTQATVITSDTLDMRGGDTETVSVFDGHVVVVGTGLRLTCDHLEVVSVRIGDKDDTIGQQDRFKSLIALGNVHIIQGEREATCGRADVRPRENKITLTENPVVKDNGNGTMASGDELVMLRGDRQVHGKNVKITAPPIRDLGADAKPSAGDAPRK